MLVPDNSDKTGMYSKPGRVSVEMFQLLQLKDEILYNKKKEFKVRSSTQNELIGNINPLDIEKSEYNMSKLKPLNQLQQNSINKNGVQMRSTGQLQTKSRKLDPMGKIVSRENRDTIGKQHREHQTFGLYNPKFHLVFEKSQLYMNPTEKKKLELQKDQLVNHSKSMSQIINKASTTNIINDKSIQQEISRIQPQGGEKDFSHILYNNSTHDYSMLGDYSKIIDWTQRKIDGPRPLQQQIPRKPFSGPIVHEKRFEEVKMPLNRVESFDIKHITGRKQHEKFDYKQTCLDYVPKFDQKEIRSSSYSFDKLIPRKLKVKTSYCANEQNFSTDEHDINKSHQLIPKIQGPKVDRMVSRHKAQVVQSYFMPLLTKVL